MVSTQSDNPCRQPEQRVDLPAAACDSRINRGGKDPYERLIADSPQGSIYCQPWWLDAVAPGRWRVLTVEKGGELVAAWPVVTSESRQGLSVVMPPLTQKLGALFATSPSKYAESLSTQHELTGQLIDQLPPTVQFRHQFHENFTNWLPFYWRGYSQTTRYTYVLDNIAHQDATWNQMRPASRKSIRKAEKIGLSVRDRLPLDRFLDLNQMVFSRQGKQPPVADETICRLDQACSRRGQRKIFSAVDKQDRIHAALYLVWDNATAYYLMSGSDPELRQSGALYLLQWEAIRFASTVAQRYDFEGSMIQNIERSFRNLGGQQRPYFVISKKPPLTAKQMINAGFWRTVRTITRRTNRQGL